MINRIFKKKSDFNFNESENVACIICDHVMNHERDILLVTHDFDDGQWGFLCGQDDHKTENYKLVSLKNVITIDKTVNDLYEMPLGYAATRQAKGQDWQPFRQNSE